MLSEDQGEDGAGCVAAGEGESAVMQTHYLA